MLDIGKYKHSRFWAVREGGPSGKLVCLCVYRKGAREVVRRLGVAGEDVPAKMKSSGGRTLNRKGAVQ